jgi:hypothetical protein
MGRLSTVRHPIRCAGARRRTVAVLARSARRAVCPFAVRFF